MTIMPPANHVTNLAPLPRTWEHFCQNWGLHPDARQCKVE